jgi:23S rRNA-/tRNA-specific pseudouridylate synthase
VEKRYHALVWGEPAWEEIQAQHPLRVNVGRKHRTAVDPRQGKAAATSLRVLERMKGAALLEAEPHTGRTHQIRAHLAALGFPILADPLYGETAEGRARVEQASRLQRLGLHAWRLACAHPLSGAAVQFEAPYPPDFAAALAALRRRPKT